MQKFRTDIFARFLKRTNDSTRICSQAKMESSVEDQQSQNSRQNLCSAQNKEIMELISDELKKHLLELDITKWNKKKKINTRYCLTGKDGSSHRVRAVKLKRLVTNYM